MALLVFHKLKKIKRSQMKLTRLMLRSLKMKERKM